MELLWQTLAFIVKIIVVVVAILIVVATIAKSKSKSSDGQKIRVKRVNDVYEAVKDNLMAAMAASGTAYTQTALKAEKQRKKQMAKSKKSQTKPEKVCYLLSYKGNKSADGVDQLREEITAILMVARPDDEVIIRLDSPGGVVNGYGLLAAQLERIKKAKLRLVVSVDKVAASGGYLAACVADEIIAAPFALIGSIGVVATIPNFHQLLKSNQVDIYEITAGEHKRSLSMLGKPTKSGQKHVEQQLEAIHKQFKHMVKQYRPQIDIESTCTGDYWTAHEAIHLGLIDRLVTSDTYIQEKIHSGDVYQLETPKKQSLVAKLHGVVTQLLHTGLEGWVL
ncbi:MAG: protease SohB [Pseudomonadota bacterium]|nr:protease SohB [Pseudomonadota bacterium]